MNLSCLGINHRTAPLEVREKVWFSSDENREMIATLKERGISECVLASTCNRTELYVSVDEHSKAPVPSWKDLVALKKSNVEAQDSHFYSIPSLHAARHLFSVASGIDSMVIGDVQILNQIKDGFSLSQELGCTGPLLNRLFAQALHVGKRARTETEIGEGAVSMGYAAAELTSKIFDDLSKRTALLIGAGETGKLTAQHLESRNIGSFVFANRTRTRAEGLARRFGGRVIELQDITTHLNSVDIVISAIDSPEYILTTAQLRHALKQRSNMSLVIIDLGVPRTIDPGANTIGNIFFHDVDTLNHIIDRNLANRVAQIRSVEQIILEELTLFHNWHRSREVTPTIQELSKQFEAIRTSELEKHRHHFSTEKQEELELLTKRIVNKILHTPITNLKNGSNADDAPTVGEKVSLLRHLFGLDRNGTE
ncbi:MAG TPA: glutamyl-tRNA reductase [Bacteroidota bacterium]|jgi:glutamyl-tRNA reductase|nr:glutamyl-tRNA reductase [Bacteroidota bacterium]